VAEQTEAEIDQARIFELRRTRFRGLGFNDRDAMMLALSGRRPREVASEIAALLAKGCSPELAREITL
jgi:hypothetical protein